MVIVQAPPVPIILLLVFVALVEVAVVAMFLRSRWVLSHPNAMQVQPQTANSVVPNTDRQAALWFVFDPWQE